MTMTPPKPEQAAQPSPPVVLTIHVAGRYRDTRGQLCRLCGTRLTEPDLAPGWPEHAPVLEAVFGEETRRARAVAGWVTELPEGTPLVMCAPAR
jgi:hypothetical protein